MDSGSAQITTFILMVDIQTPGWESSMIKFLKGIPGATFSIDPNGVARVSGKIEPGAGLKLLAKAGNVAQVYCIDSGSRNQTSGRRDHNGHHFLDDPRGRYWQPNHHYYHAHHPYDPYPPPPPPYHLQPPMAPPPPYILQPPMPPSDQCTIM